MGVQKISRDLDKLMAEALQMQAETKQLVKEIFHSLFPLVHKSSSSVIYDITNDSDMIIVKFPIGGTDYLIQRGPYNKGNDTFITALSSESGTLEVPYKLADAFVKFIKRVNEEIFYEDIS